jgi:hypothetical protein
VPGSFHKAGWFRPGPEPGERGAAVIAGHFDSVSGPGVFFRLRALKPGDDITVVVKGGSRVHFAVTSMRAVPKTRFPTKLVYRHTPRPTLRLITCDGAFDSATGHYVDNYIVFATLRQGSRPETAPVQLLPDLRPVAPSGITVLDVKHRFQLGFLSAATNVGMGPLVIHGSRSAGQSDMTAEQLIHLSSGAEQVVPNAGRMHYVVNPDHQHWHLEPFMHYVLRRAADGRLVGRDRKTGFCLGDRYFGANLPQAPRRKVFRTDCGRDQTRLTHVAEGISVGWGDDYAAILEGQSIDITGLPAGRYYLVHQVNGSRRLVEASYTNNVSWVLLRLTWHHSRPRVRLLAHCAPSTQQQSCDRLGR